MILKAKNKAGDILGNSEKTATDKKRERRKKKSLKRLKIQEKERKQKLKEAANEGKGSKKSKAQVQETLKQLTKGGKAKVLTVSVEFSSVTYKRCKMTSTGFIIGYVSIGIKYL